MADNCGPSAKTEFEHSLVTLARTVWGRCRTVVPAALLVAQTLPFGAIRRVVFNLSVRLASFIYIDIVLLSDLPSAPPHSQP